MASDENCVVIDNGSYMIKAGSRIGADDEEFDRPSRTFRSTLGSESHGRGLGMNEEYFEESKTGIGADYQGRAGTHTTYVIKQGVVTDWDAMERIWRYCGAEETNVIMNMPTMKTGQFSAEILDRAAIILFEKLDNKRVNFQHSAAVSMYSHGISTSLVVDVGHASTRITPEYEGYGLPHATKIVNDFGATTVAAALVDQLVAVSYSVNLAAKRSAHKLLEEGACFVQPSRGETKDDEDDRTFTLHDSSEVCLSAEARGRPAEALFGANQDGANIAQLAYESIMECDVDIRKDLFQNIVLSGSVTQLPGLKERFMSEIKTLAPPNIVVNILADLNHPGEKAWAGMKTLSGMSTFDSMFVTREEYDKDPRVVHRKCF